MNSESINLMMTVVGLVALYSLLSNFAQELDDAEGFNDDETDEEEVG